MIKVRFAEEKDLPDIDRLLNQVNLLHHEIRPDLFNIGRKYTDEQFAAMARVFNTTGNYSQRLSFRIRTVRFLQL